jgi:hypothetical protein
VYREKSFSYREENFSLYRLMIVFSFRFMTVFSYKLMIIFGFRLMIAFTFRLMIVFSFRYMFLIERTIVLLCYGCDVPHLFRYGAREEYK